MRRCIAARSSAFIRGVEELARERGAESPLPAPLMATHLALGNGLRLERLTRPDEIDIEDSQAALLLAWGATPPEGARE